jgi:hypothetical protein
MSELFDGAKSKRASMRLSAEAAQGAAIRNPVPRRRCDIHVGEIETTSEPDFDIR